MILVGKKWDIMDDWQTCCLSTIGVIRKAYADCRRRGETVDNLCARCAVCGKAWVLQPAIHGTDIRLAIRRDGTPHLDRRVTTDEADEEV